MAFIQKRPDRTLPWSVIWRDPATKKQKERAFATKKAADAFKDTVSTEIRQGTYVDPSPVPFETFATGWLERTQPTVSPNTHGVHEWAVNGYLIPAFKLVAIQALTAERIEQWQAVLLKRKKPGPRSVEMAKGVLRTILEDARSKRYLFKNPMEDVRDFEVPERELTFLKPDQVKGLCELAGPFYAILFLVMAFCGVRIGEATGLQITDLDLVNGLLFVQRQVIWRRKKDTPAGEPRWKFTPPKSKAGIRVVEIPAPMIPLLVAYLKTLDRPNPLGLVFPSEVGTPLYPKTVRRRHFLPAMKVLGIKGVRQHDLRRTFIAIHVAAGTYPKLVQERAGQSTITLTMNVYGKIAGKMPLTSEQRARLDGIASTALPGGFPENGNARQPERKALGTGDGKRKDSEMGTTS